jgi:cation diffusion facilitator CzcD-associated flavoprotein CzcO
LLRADRGGDSNPRLNPVPGLENFKGEVVHPAHWKSDTSVKGKNVALVGYGCSGVQIGPNIINDVSKLYTWFRNKTYILPPPNQAFSAEGGANFKCRLKKLCIPRTPLLLTPP